MNNLSVKHSTGRIEQLYALALHLYPAPFHAAYAAPMQQALRDALADRTLARRSLMTTTLRDLATSLFKEHLAMFRTTYRPALLFNAFILAGIATGIALALYAIPQQILRNGANDPQIQMATDLAARLDGGPGVADGLLQAQLSANSGVIDMARSLSPFLIVYDDQGNPLGSNAQLNGATPAPPRGVFDYVRSHGEERVTWEPIRASHTLRIAAVVERVKGPHPGFVLAGRSMREVEARIEQVRQMAGLTWLGMLALIAIGTLVYGRLTRTSPTPIPAPH
ncbi:hypothetical protein DYQ86_21510 [Acidobacteria bacterium AB60]|nr:hypothetical protein DYQ86_21510 [Acidobacteria bacterium AB60]